MSLDIVFAGPLDRYVIIDNGMKLRSIIFQQYHTEERRTFPVTFELEEYFNGKLTEFSCDPDLSGLTQFQKKVLEETRKIGYGRTITYSELAGNIRSRAYRAVGRALAANPVPIVIPCHRVVAKNGLGGYSQGTVIKRKLLELEAKFSNNL